jgi:uncharacterized protein
MKSNLIENAQLFVKELMRSNDPSHDWYHVERVWRNAVHIAKKEKEMNSQLEINMELVELSALFHDVVDFKYDHQKKINSSTDIHNSCSLSEIARDRLRPFFEVNRVPFEIQEKVLYIILNISWRKQLDSEKSGQTEDNSMEFKIVRDADRLDAVGAIGIARCFGYSCIKNRPFYLPEIEPMRNMTAEEYNNQTRQNQGTAINHFHEKLLHIKDKMTTKTGIFLAEQRHRYMLDYLEQFNMENNLNC